jgi:hypothetical protein
MAVKRIVRTSRERARCSSIREINLPPIPYFCKRFLEKFSRSSEAGQEQPDGVLANDKMLRRAFWGPKWSDGEGSKLENGGRMA